MSINTGGNTEKRDMFYYGTGAERDILLTRIQIRILPNVKNKNKKN